MYKKIAYGTLFYSGIGNIMNFLSRKPKAIILAYHHISPLNGKNTLLKDLYVDPHVFEKQVEYLRAHYDIVSVDKILEYINSGSKSLGNSLAITFDDAYADIYENAFPILRKYGLPATVFVPTAFIEGENTFWWEGLEDMISKTRKEGITFNFKKKNYYFNLNFGRRKAFFCIARLFKSRRLNEQEELFYLLEEALSVDREKVRSFCLSWNQIKEMSQCGISFGAHTHTHQSLSSLDGATLEEELYKPKEILDNRLGQKTDSFAYPYGETADFNAQSMEAVKTAGYKYALTMAQGLVSFGDNVFSLLRIGLGAQDTRETFRLKLSGLIPLRKRSKYTKLY